TAGQFSDFGCGNRSQGDEVSGVFPCMVEDVALTAPPIRHRSAHQLAEVLIVHNGVGAECHKVIESSHAQCQVSFEQVIHQGHGHGAGAVGDNHQHVLAVNGQRTQCLLHDRADLLAGEITIGESSSNTHRTFFS